MSTEKNAADDCTHNALYLLRHQRINGEIWTRCLNCGKTWNGKMPYMPEQKLYPPEALKLYLDKYLDIASGGRVKFDYMSYGSSKFLRFHCSKCTQNWNVSLSLFGVLDGTCIPTELTDWVELHKHVCSNFGTGIPSEKVSYTAPNTKCKACGWAFHQHKQAQPVWSFEKDQWVTPDPTAYVQYNPVNSGMLKLGDPELMKNSERAKPKLTNVHEPVKGRRFRKEEEC